MRRFIMSAAIILSFITGVVEHHRVEIITRPYRCAVVQYFNPSAKCDAYTERHTPPKIKQALPGQKQDG